LDNKSAPERLIEGSSLVRVVFIALHIVRRSQRNATLLKKPLARARTAMRPFQPPGLGQATLECGGKRSAPARRSATSRRRDTALAPAAPGFLDAPGGRKRRRRFRLLRGYGGQVALPAHSKRPLFHRPWRGFQSAKKTAKKMLTSNYILIRLHLE
jgi:hypothetical protein